MTTKRQIVCALALLWLSSPSWALELNASEKRELGAATIASIASAPKLGLSSTDVVVIPPDPGWELGTVSSVAIDGQGFIYLLQRGDKANPVVVIDTAGRVIRSWGKGLFKMPHYVRIDPQGNVWTVDAQSSTVRKFTPEGVQLLQIEVGGQPTGTSPFVGTTDIAFAPDGRLFVTDGYANARIVMYSALGERLGEFGNPGTGSGELNLPHAIVCDDAGVLYVADRENGRIQRFALDGTALGSWNVGKTYSLKLAGGFLWAGMQPVDRPTGSAGWVVKLDPKTGVFLGSVELTEPFGLHTIDVNASGEPLTSVRQRVVRFRRNP